MPLESAVRALRRLAPGADLRRPRTRELRVLAEALRGDVIDRLGEQHPEEVTATVLAHQLTALDRAMTGFFGPEGAPRTECARLVRAARFSGGRIGPPAVLLGRLRTESGLRAAAVGWAEAVGYRVLAHALCRPCRPAALTTEEIRLAASLAIDALLPRAVRQPAEPTTRWQPVQPVSGPYGATLDVMTVVFDRNGFQVTVGAEEPVDLERTGPEVTLRALRWTGLVRIRDDLGYEYLILARDHRPGDGPFVHWCHPRPVPGAGELHLESGSYQGEQLSFAAHCTDRPTRTAVEIPVRIELTASLRG